MIKSAPTASGLFSELNADGRQAIHRATCELVLAETQRRTANLSDPTIGGLADVRVQGAFVSLKRGKELRSCVGFSGKTTPLAEALEYAANRCVHHDPRFPPVQTDELSGLDVEIWLLGEQIKVTGDPQQRFQAIRVGRDGLLIEKDGKRGLLLPGVAVEHGFDERTFLNQVCRKAGLPTDAWQDPDSTLYRFEGVSIKAPYVDPYKLLRQVSVSVRQPAVAGRFYPATKDQCVEMLESLAPASPPSTDQKNCRPLLLPHAGWMYSGRVAMEVLSRVSLAERIIVIGPKHTPLGQRLAVSPCAAWKTPLGDIPSDSDLASKLVRKVEGFVFDDLAHRNEHGIEVILPQLQYHRPDFRVVGITIGTCSLKECLRIGKQLGQVLSEESSPVQVVVSSDMNHFEDDQRTREKDRLALDALTTGEPEKLYNTVQANRITMCGMMPATIALAAFHAAGMPLNVEPVAYATSAETSGDAGRVVGYAGVLF